MIVHSLFGLVVLREHLSEATQADVGTLAATTASREVGCVELLIAAGCNVSIQSESGMTALHNAAVNGTAREGPRGGIRDRFPRVLSLGCCCFVVEPSLSASAYPNPGGQYPNSQIAVSGLPTSTRDHRENVPYP